MAARRGRHRRCDAARRCGCAGRIDRLERDAQGRLVVVDVKTGKTPVSKDDAQRHAQLALYQLAVAQGCCRRAISPAAAGWSTSARPPRAGPPNVNRTR